MLVNNETGVIQPVEELARLARKYGHRMHTDAVQAAGRLPIDFVALGVDFLTLSAHKIGGPQGIGALIAHEKVAFKPLLKGGRQEMNRRAGTENVAGIVGFGIAARLAADDLRETPRLEMWRDELQMRLLEIGGEDVFVAGRRCPARRQYAVHRHARCKQRNAGGRHGSGRSGRQRRLCLLQRQGQGFACAERHGLRERCGRDRPCAFPSADGTQKKAISPAASKPGAALYERTHENKRKAA